MNKIINLSLNMNTSLMNTGFYLIRDPKIVKVDIHQCAYTPVNMLPSYWTVGEFMRNAIIYKSSVGRLKPGDGDG